MWSQLKKLRENSITQPGKESITYAQWKKRYRTKNGQDISLILHNFCKTTNNHVGQRDLKHNHFPYDVWNKSEKIPRMSTNAQVLFLHQCNKSYTIVVTLQGIHFKR